LFDSASPGGSDNLTKLPSKMSTELHPKIIDVTEMDRLLYTERPPCPRALQAALQDCFDRALVGSVDHQVFIAFCLSYAAGGHDPESVQKFMFICATARLPYVNC
jgi:hypothetical protein